MLCRTKETLKKSFPTISLLILSLALLSGCVSPKRIVVSDYCMVAQQITFTEADLAGMTESIAKQIEGHNFMHEQMCQK